MQVNIRAWGPTDYAMSLGRVSDVQQTSVPEQHAINRETAAAIGLTIPADAFYDDVQSRTVDLSHRADLQAALTRMEDPRCAALLIWNDSRLLGDELQAIVIFTALAESGTRLFAKDGVEIDVATREALLIGMLKGWQNKNEVLRTRERVRDTHQQKAKAGRMISRPPYGIRAVPLVEAPCKGKCLGDHRSCTSLHGELSKKNTVWVVQEEEMANLRLMFSMMAEGRTWGELERAISNRGIRSPTRILTRSRNDTGKEIGGKVIEKSQLRRYLTNTFYAGYFTWNRQRVVRIKNQSKQVDNPPSEWIIERHSLGPLIDQEVFDKAQANIARRNMKRDELRVYPPRLYDRLMVCGRCGWGMSLRKNAYVPKNGGEGSYIYACHGVYRQYSSCTKNHIIAENTLDYYFGIAVGGQGRKVPELEVTFTVASEGAVARMGLEAIENRITQLQQSFDRAEEMYIRSGWTIEKLDAMQAGIKAEMDQALEEQAQILSLPVGSMATTTVPQALADLMPLLRNEEIPMLERQLTLGRLVDRIVVDRPSVRVIWREEPTEA